MPRKTKDQSELESENVLENKAVKKSTRAKKATTTAKKVSDTKAKKTSSTSKTSKSTNKKSSDSKKVAAKKSKVSDTKEDSTKDKKATATVKKAAGTKTKKASATVKKTADTKAKKTTATAKKVADTKAKKASTTAKKVADTKAKKTSTTAKKTADTKVKKSTTTTKKAAGTRAKKASTVTKNANASTSRKSIVKAVVKEVDEKKFDVVEYYDLPYRYNQTVVRLLAQTPNTLFIYWDVADSDRNSLKEQYGYDFFDKTYPVLIVYNDSMNYSFEVPINDFANCWYLHVNDSFCNYHVELGRKPVWDYSPNDNFSEEDLKNMDLEINKYPSKPLDKNYFYITTSNVLEIPNDHVLFNGSSKYVQFRNVKTNEQYGRLISDLPLKNVKDYVYKLYKEGLFEDVFDLSNPSSGNPSSGSFNLKFK